MTNSGDYVQGTGAKIDQTVPHSARVWNYWLGGKDNFEVDRQVGDQFAGALPRHHGGRAQLAGVLEQGRYLPCPRWWNSAVPRHRHWAADRRKHP